MISVDVFITVLYGIIYSVFVVLHAKHCNIKKHTQRFQNFSYSAVSLLKKNNKGKHGILHLYVMYYIYYKILHPTYVQA